MTIFERIKKLAEKQGKPLQKISDDLGFGVNYIYRLKTQQPTAEKLELIADYFHVSVDYLLGREEDVSWELWQDVTGYSIEQIKNEISRMKSANHILGDKNDLQNVIGQAVANLSGHGETERGIIEGVFQGINHLKHEVSERYKDPEKLKKYNSNEKGLNISPANADIFYDDLSEEVYSKIFDILEVAQRDLDRLKNDSKSR